MSDEDLSPLLAELYEAERTAPPLRDEVRAELWASIEGAVAAGPGGGGGGDGGAGPNPGAPSAPRPLSRSPAASYALGLGLFLGGAIVGAALHAWWSEPVVIVAEAPEEGSAEAPRAESSQTPSPAIPPLAEAVDADEPETAPEATAPEATAPGTTAPSPRAAQAPLDTLRQERPMIDAARASLLLGEHEAALRSLSRHERRFPDGQLLEDRESLIIRALVAAGRRPEAEARAVRFRSQHPSSLLTPSIDAALAR